MTDWSERLNLVCFEPLKYERPWELATYEKIGGYQAWRKILAEKPPREQVTTMGGLTLHRDIIALPAVA